MKSPNSKSFPLFSFGLVTVSFLAATVSSLAQTVPCIENNGVKFIMPPNFFGMDIRDSQTGIVLADDFKCTTTGPITDIHLWGSWLSDTKGLVTNFWIGIYSDVPAMTNLPTGQVIPSHPGILLWYQTFGLGQYHEEQVNTNVEEAFYDPISKTVVGFDLHPWYYCFYPDPANRFVQQGTASTPTNYWLAVYAQLGDQTSLFGWKNSSSNYNDAAVWGTVDASGKPSGNWQSITNAQNLLPINLSFKLTTTNNPPPPTDCIESNGVKYVQWPNLFGGYDVDNNYYVLADDFVCTNSGPITDIHLWGSWLFDTPVTNTLVFWLGIYDDVQPGPGSNFSHPGTNLLWQQWFGPGQYSESKWATGQEYFLDPGSQQIIGGDTQAWYYCFYPSNPFTQSGNLTAPKTYWLAAYAQLPAGTSGGASGWKTTTNLLHDISVHALWPGVPPTNNPGWTPTLLPTGGPLDLAFKLTTPTNQCFIQVGCPPPGKTVKCYDPWTFDQPTVGKPPCCPNPTVLFRSYTNSYGCSNSITGWWVILDCSGNTVGVCTQVVTVLEQGLAWTCTTNKTVVCGSPWSFDTPTAFDPCSGTSLPFWVTSTVTNNLGPCQQTVTRTWVVTNLCGEAATCSQTVTNVATNPPIMNCPTNKTVISGSSWTFDTPTAIDACSGVTVPVSVVNTVTNGKDPCNLVITRNWLAVDACNNRAVCSQSVTNICPPVQCVESDGVKYQQWPNIYGGFDVLNNPYVLADDFVCTNRGLISDIHLWGSWYNDNPLTNTITFWLGIYDDVPAITNVDGKIIAPSHPGTNLLWQQWFSPGHYAETVWTPNAQEQFLNPGSSNVIGPDSMVWYYCFYPTNAFMQMGTPTHQVIYWLAAYAQSPAGINQLYGWKTATNMLHDVSVHATWPGVPPINNVGWTPTAYQPAAGGPAIPLDLSFKLTTCGPVRIQYLSPTNVVVSWEGGGILQSSPNVAGPYLDVPGFPASPFTDYSVSPTNKFYRLRCY